MELSNYVWHDRDKEKLHTFDGKAHYIKECFGHKNNIYFNYWAIERHVGYIHNLIKYIIQKTSGVWLTPYSSSPLEQISFEKNNHKILSFKMK